MRVVSLSMVKNEQDVIKPFIRHHARLVDYMLVVGNASVDDTRRIAIDYARELGNLVVTDATEFANAQGERITQLLYQGPTSFCRLRRRGGSRVVAIGAGGDPGRRGGAACVVQFRVAWAGGRADGGGPSADGRWRRRTEMPQFDKVVLRLNGGDGRDLSVTFGSHEVRAGDGSALPGVEMAGVELLAPPGAEPRDLSP
jgi:hypothetical protein